MQPSVTLTFDDFFTPERVTVACQQIAEGLPDFARLHTIGRTLQGRDILLLEVSDFRTGDPDGRPGYYIDAVTHADEVVGISVAMYIAWRLTEGAAAGDERISKLLQRVVFYINPMVNPDGVDVVLNQRYPWIGNGRYLPGEEQLGPGFHYGDVDSNRIIAQMRMRDPNGEWKVSKLDDRLLVLRAPDEEDDGPYYRLMPEGYFREWDGATMVFEGKPRDGNLNRNYPTNWQPERLQDGAGQYPTSEPEIRAVVDWILAHPNTASVMSYHTQGGLILRPFASRPDSAFPPGDLQLYKALGAMGTEETGYPLISTFSDFTPEPVKARGGMLTDWTYDELGLPSFVTELWNLYREAGVEDVPFYSWAPLPEETMLQALQWTEQNVPDGFLPWRPFDHPQLGPIEVGGWNRIFVFRNPPKTLLEPIAEENFRFVMRLAATLPRIEVEKVDVTRQGENVFVVEAVIANAGYLASCLTRMALDNNYAEPVRAELQGDGVQLLDGGSTREIGHLSGRSERRMEWIPWADPWGASRTTIRWIVQGEPGARLLVRAGCPRAGGDSREFILA